MIHRAEQFLAYAKRRAVVSNPPHDISLPDVESLDRALLKIHKLHKSPSDIHDAPDGDNIYTLYFTVELPRGAEVPQSMLQSPVAVADRFIGKEDDASAPEWLQWPRDSVWFVQISRRDASHLFKIMAKYPENLETHHVARPYLAAYAHIEARNILIHQTPLNLTCIFVPVLSINHVPENILIVINGTSMNVSITRHVRAKQLQPKLTEQRSPRIQVFTALKKHIATAVG
ncbi:uncharacterized protein LAESUDRAFT_715991 [Laetiporus sulphureus 93-53]|uniref:Uncharacterized protein n=1 Tax=Laetiporus sulphureus 93-53 TaxID=1314785 RepID=A0A165CZX0_9APHY|nr:uncharacterized protein LAESUDRAFT_715991 [Laetiporus sulphureus 93-53]KZT03852.1 hypothetical protein LAESUDRAFT_715991 [Laetiporus sulphureus 93-53]